jgi:hypothetical protein
VALSVRLPVPIDQYMCFRRIDSGPRKDSPFRQKEGQAAEFHVLSVQLPSNCVGSPGFNLTVGPAMQRDTLVHTVFPDLATLYPLLRY